MGQLTPARELRIKTAVGNACEFPRCKNGAYEVHHIKPRSEKGQDVASNLIVLCANHHDDADKGRITRGELTDIVKKRKDNVKREIRNILRAKVGKEKKYVIIDNIYVGKIKVLIEDTEMTNRSGKKVPVIKQEAFLAGRYEKVK